MKRLDETMSWVKIAETDDTIVKYDRDRGMYVVSIFEDGHYKYEVWFDAYEEKELPETKDVVRCKDCKHFEPDEIVAASSGTCWYCEMVRMFDDFCSRGELKR